MGKGGLDIWSATKDHAEQEQEQGPRRQCRPVTPPYLITSQYRGQEKEAGAGHQGDQQWHTERRGV